jgi:hypothetical protein
MGSRSHAASPSASVRRISACRWGGLAAGLVAAFLVASWDAVSLGRGALLAGPMVGLGVLAGVLIGEFTARKPDGPTQQAIVEVRRTQDYLPPQLSRAVAAAAGVLAVLLLITTLAGSADDLGRRGRELIRACNALYSEGHSPWAGLFYSLPLALLVLVGLGIAAAALHRIVQRPRLDDQPGRTSEDDALRRRAADAVTGACGVLVSVPLAEVCLVTAGGLLGISCRPFWWNLAAWILLLSVPVWLALLGWSCVAVLFPRPVRPSAP